MTQTRYRIVLTLLGLALAVIVIAAVVFMPSGRSPGLPDTVETYSPTDGDTVQRQTRVVVDLEPGYDISLVVDGAPIPSTEISVIEATGVFTWEPGEGRSVEAWIPGLHVVEVTWDRATGLPDPGSLRWSFRVQ